MRGGRKRDCALILFTRLPAAGRTKTRLMPYFSGEQCRELHIAMLKDLKESLKKLKGVDIYLYFLGEEGEDRKKEDRKRAPKSLKRIFGSSFRYRRQRGENLFERMALSMEELSKEGYRRIVLIGTDIPELRANDIRLAFQLLSESDAVLGPTEDGGYYLIGVRQPGRELFLPEPGEGSVFSRTKAAILQSGRTVSLLRHCRDIDTKEDIAVYRERIRSEPVLRRSHCGSFLIMSLSIAVIVPLYNERKTIDRLKRELSALKGSCELILVDGGSTDGTWEELRKGKGWKLLRSEKGRARQMNLGAEKTSADVLFFLHSDSELPPDVPGEIRRVLARTSAGCFGIAFHSASPLMRICQFISNHRVYDRRVMFGDQGIFLYRTLFEELGGFPLLPLMEDYQLSLNLKERGICPLLCKGRIYTSERRFRGGFFRRLHLMWQMNRLRKRYRDGVDIREIAERYRDVR